MIGLKLLMECEKENTSDLLICCAVCLTKIFLGCCEIECVSPIMESTTIIRVAYQQRAWCIQVTNISIIVAMKELIQFFLISPLLHIFVAKLDDIQSGFLLSMETRGNTLSIEIC